MLLKEIRSKYKQAYALILTEKFGGHSNSNSGRDGIMSGKCRFNHAWLQMEKYMSWVKTDEDPGRVKCRLCGGKTFDISNMGEAALTINEPCQRKLTERCY